MLTPGEWDDDVPGDGVVQVKLHGILLQAQHVGEDLVVEVFEARVLRLSDRHVLRHQVDRRGHLA